MKYVYITTNLVNGKKYIGVNLKDNDSRYLGSGIRLKNAIKKYGVENFKKEIIASFETEKEAREYERALIKEKDAIKLDEFYNLAPGGYGGGTGHPCTEEAKIRIANALKGRKRPREMVERIAKKLRGRKQSSELREKRSIAVKQSWESRPIKDRIRMSELGHKNKGKKHSEEIKIHISQIRARLSEQQVLDICRLAKSVSYQVLAKQFKINPSSISAIVNKKSYKWIWKKEGNASK